MESLTPSSPSHKRLNSFSFFCSRLKFILFIGLLFSPFKFSILFNMKRLDFQPAYLQSYLFEGCNSFGDQNTYVLTYYEFVIWSTLVESTSIKGSWFTFLFNICLWDLFYWMNSQLLNAFLYFFLWYKILKVHCNHSCLLGASWFLMLKILILAQILSQSWNGLKKTLKVQALLICLIVCKEWVRWLIAHSSLYLRDRLVRLKFSM